MTIKGTPFQLEAQRLFKKHMLDRLKKKPWIADHCKQLCSLIVAQILMPSYFSVMPDFGVTCRRLTPGPGYLEALEADNVSSCDKGD